MFGDILKNDVRYGLFFQKVWLSFMQWLVMISRVVIRVICMVVMVLMVGLKFYFRQLISVICKVVLLGLIRNSDFFRLMKELIKVNSDLVIMFGLMIGRVMCQNIVNGFVFRLCVVFLMEGLIEISVVVISLVIQGSVISLWVISRFVLVLVMCQLVRNFIFRKNMNSVLLLMMLGIIIGDISIVLIVLCFLKWVCVRVKLVGRFRIKVMLVVIRLVWMLRKKLLWKFDSFYVCRYQFSVQFCGGKDRILLEKKFIQMMKIKGRVMKLMVSMVKVV